MPEFTTESARAAAALSAETRRRKRELTPEERAHAAIGARLGSLTNELLKAAMGEGDFEELKLETRVTAIVKAMEWRLGRPTVAKQDASPDEPETPTAEGLFESVVPQ